MKNFTNAFFVLLYILSYSHFTSAADADTLGECAEFSTKNSSYIGKICSVYSGNYKVYSVNIESFETREKRFYLKTGLGLVFIEQASNSLLFFDSKISAPDVRRLVGTWTTNSILTGGIFFSNIISFSEIESIFQGARAHVVIKYLGERTSICTRRGVKNSLLKDTIDPLALKDPTVIRALNSVASLIYSRCRLSKVKQFKYEGMRITFVQ